MNKLAVCIIVKNDSEALLLSQALASVAQYVQDIFVTGTKEPQDKIREIVKEYNGKWSFFPWINDFSAARNFNWSQVPKDFTYIFWIDADDIVLGSQHIPDIIQKMDDEKLDAVNFPYLYAFDADGNCIAQEDDKARILRNDNCVEWYSEIHEGFKQNRTLAVHSTDKIKIRHNTNDSRIAESMVRNLEIAKSVYEKKPTEARSFWLLGNAYQQAATQDHKKSIEWWEKFIPITSSEEERFTAHLRLSNSARELRDWQKAISGALNCIAIFPGYPDGYYSLADTYLKMGKYERSLELIFIGMRLNPPKGRIIGYNPREYDLRPYQLLFQIYSTSDVRKAKAVLEQIYKLQPSKKSKDLLEHFTKEIKRLEGVEQIYAKAKEKKTKEEIKQLLNSIDKDLRNHPGIVSLWNELFVKETSSGKDITYYCPFTSHTWNPDVAREKGVGGSEEAVIHLTKRWAKQGYNVTVYCNTGHNEEKIYDGVTWKPFWSLNVKDKVDYFIIWRAPRVLDYEINAT